MKTLGAVSGLSVLGGGKMTGISDCGLGAVGGAGMPDLAAAVLLLLEEVALAAQLDELAPDDAAGLAGDALRGEAPLAARRGDLAGALSGDAPRVRGGVIALAGTKAHGVSGTTGGGTAGADLTMCSKSCGASGSSLFSTTSLSKPVVLNAVPAPPPMKYMRG